MRHDALISFSPNSKLASDLDKTNPSAMQCKRDQPKLYMAVEGKMAAPGGRWRLQLRSDPKWTVHRLRDFCIRLQSGGPSSLALSISAFLALLAMLALLTCQDMQFISTRNVLEACRSLPLLEPLPRESRRWRCFLGGAQSQKDQLLPTLPSFPP